jgi:hypothetical protein
MQWYRGNAQASEASAKGVRRVSPASPFSAGFHLPGCLTIYGADRAG